MRILYLAVAYDSGKSGISIYINETLLRLAQNKSNQIRVICTQADYSLLPQQLGIHYQVLPRIFNSAIMNMALIYLFFGFLYKKSEHDVLFLPAANRRTPLWSKLFSVGVVHDLSQYHIEAKYDIFRMFYIKRLLPLAIKKLHKIVSVSQSTADDLIKYYHIKAEKIEVNYNGFDRAIFKEQKVLLAEKYQSFGEYIFYVSRIEHPGKNHLRLIQAYEKLPSDVQDKYALVLAGTPWTRATEVLDYAKKSAIADRIHWIGFVGVDELAMLYSNAKLYIFPSLFEGFGLSIAEAMGCETPVACSNNSSLGEIAGDAALQFNPYEVDEIRKSMESILSSEELANQLRKKGIERIKLFDWDKHVSKLEASFEDSIQRENHLFSVKFDNFTLAEMLDNISKAIKGREAKKIAFVNADCFNQAYNNEIYKNLLRKFDYVCADGSGVALAGKILKRPVRDNVNGTDMLPHLAQLASDNNFSVFLYGAQKGIADKMKDNLLLKYPKLNICGTLSGYADKEMAVQHIANAKADILLVALGVPLQEKFIVEHFAQLNCSIALGVGGLFDFYSGRIARAPQFLRKIGMEWSFRLLMEPRLKFKRYIIGNPVFMFRVFKEKYLK